jgi:putative membrane protein
MVFFPGSGSLAHRLVAFAVWWAISAASVWVAAYLVAGIHLDGWESAAIVGLMLGLVNALVRPVVLTLTFPATILTLGTWRLVAGALINAGLLWIASRVAGQYPGLHFRLDDFLWDGVLGGLIVGVVGWGVGLFASPRRIARRVVG